MKCESCNGTGKYIGFFIEENCKSCLGKGIIESNNCISTDEFIYDKCHMYKFLKLPLLIKDGFDLTDEEIYDVFNTSRLLGSSKQKEFVDKRKAVLAKHLSSLSKNNSIEDIYDLIEKTHERYCFEDKTYLVLTDEDAYDICGTYIIDNIWAFNSEFVYNYIKPNIPIKILKNLQLQEYENCNELIFHLIEDFDKFVDDAICVDGRGHFISSYDGKEIEETIGDETYYIYRMD